MLNRLREETEALHREIEKDNLANKIMDHSINLEEYKSLLFQNFIAYSIAESEIRKFLDGTTGDKSKNIFKDLKALGIDPSVPDLEFTCNNEAEAIGAAYVIEGSAMGGMIIGKEIDNCNSLKELPVQEFFNGNRSNIKSWNNFLKFLRSREFSKEETDLAAEKAKQTFMLFQEAFRVSLANSC
ncbi:MAG: biliverdin-producing heme oxygenase [Gramella sp.]|nr:biliverdin-producing heme oxygenase [Christiangramia sp.]